MLQVRRLLGDTATQVALMMAPLLPRIHTGVGNWGGNIGGFQRGGGEIPLSWSTLVEGDEQPLNK